MRSELRIIVALTSASSPMPRTTLRTAERAAARAEPPVPLLAPEVLKLFDPLGNRDGNGVPYCEQSDPAMETVESLANRGEWAAAVSRTGAWWRGKAARSFLQGFAAG